MPASVTTLLDPGSTNNDQGVIIGKNMDIPPETTLGGNVTGKTERLNPVTLREICVNALVASVQVRKPVSIFATCVDFMSWNQKC